MVKRYYSVGKIIMHRALEGDDLQLGEAHDSVVAKVVVNALNTMTHKPPMGKVIDDDRDAALELLWELYPDECNDVESEIYGVRVRMEIGQEDSHPFVQAFRKYREKCSG